MALVYTFTKQRAGDSITLAELARSSSCVCGFRGTLSEVIDHHTAWRRHGVCLYPVAVMRARRAGYSSYVPLAADPGYYVRAWLRIKKGMIRTKKDGILWAAVWYKSEDPEFCADFMHVGEVSRWRY